MPKKLSEIIAVLPPADVLHVTGDAKISGPLVEADREVRPGGIFVARLGNTVDGHEFIPNAVRRGAAAIIGEQQIDNLPVPYVQVRDAQAAIGWLAAAYHDFPARKLTIIGVTGTDGKTTTSTLIYHILQRATANRTGLISTIAAELGGMTSDTGLHVTTPGAPQVQQYMAQMVANGLTHCVLEMTSHGLVQGRLNGVDIDVAVLTNVTHEHLDYHGSWEAYRAAKARMFTMLTQTYRKPGQPKIAVINTDDPSADFFAAIPADRVLRYGLWPADCGAGLYAENVRYAPDGTYIHTISMPEGDSHEYFTHLVGQFNVSNTLAAITTVRTVMESAGGLQASAIEQGLADVALISGRMEPIDEGQDFLALVDFAHTPNALKNVLEAARAMLPEGKRLFAVFGSAGLRDVEKRRLMAETAAQLADFTILTAEDPRTEALVSILEMMAEGCVAQGGVEGQTFIRVPDRGAALYRACQMAQAGDIVLACGKGHEQSMCFGTIEYPWDDREALRAALRGTPLGTLPTAD